MMIDREGLQEYLDEIGVAWFSAREFLRLRRAREFGFDPEAELPHSFIRAAQEVLWLADELRERHAAPIICGNGYRPPHYNRNVAGSKNSAHIRGAAMDLDPTQDAEDFAVLAARCWLGTPWFHGIGIYRGRVHIDVDHPGSAGKRAWPNRWNPASRCARVLRKARKLGPITLKRGFDHDAV